MCAGDLSMGLSLAGGALTPGRWGHVAFAVDTTGTAKLFVDGAEVASGSFQGVHFCFNGTQLHCYFRPYQSAFYRLCNSTPSFSASLTVDVACAHPHCVRRAPPPGPRMMLEDCDMRVGESLDIERAFSGHVYDFRLWSRALAPDEVASGFKVPTLTFRNA